MTIPPGRLVMVGITGKTLDDAQATFLRRHAIRAVVLFRDNLGDEDAVRALTRRLRDVMGPDALIALDQEGGAVVRATEGDLLVFSSGHFLRVLAARWCGLDAASGRYLYLGTAALCVLGYEHGSDDPVLRLWNDDRHVQP